MQMNLEHKQEKVEVHATLVFAQCGNITVHATLPIYREHLTIISCMNLAGESIPIFYIFKGKQKHRDYVVSYEPAVAMAMQQNGWMTTFLFNSSLDNCKYTIRILFCYFKCIFGCVLWLFCSLFVVFSDQFGCFVMMFVHLESILFDWMDVC